jgi:HAD superfamily hydrolase (TIGR01509 family)
LAEVSYAGSKVVDTRFQLKAVIFDLDGLILDSERCYFRCWQRAAADLGFELGESQYGDLAGIPNDRAEIMLAEMMGEVFPLADFRVIWNTYWDELLQCEEIPVKPGVLELLELLDARSIPRAIASSSFERDVLACLGRWLARFPVIVSRDMVANGKPAPDLFLAAAQRLGVAPRHCLVLEDSDVGIRAAASAGMPVILVPDINQPSPEAVAAAWRVCESLHDVADLIRNATANGLGSSAIK